MTVAAAAAVAARERHIIQAFRNARATSMHDAKSLADLGVDDSWILRRWVNSGVVKTASPGTYYLDEATYTEMLKRRQTTAVVILTILVLAGAIAAYFVMGTIKP